MYIFRTKSGVFSIARRNGRWDAIYGPDKLGTYPTEEKAAEDLASGHFLMPGTATLSIPADLSKWEQTRN